ncbi:response regulator [Christiangramia echinicola]|uniref:CheY chemotaxis protein or a CheY-like REC (Receiver) domain n=1 Tax=Christiangramia echinicola TaxID=279359 RepID=A0A1H1LTN2_9FLAO|nr:response regulator [Christiangramia echinicola]SDR77777.1 CheY chemotaxis protein or a CheY-like REC (receiver) domain [Christiangramia echinicola]
MRKSVWVIDDDEIYQMIIKKLIQKSGVFEDRYFFKGAKQVISELEKSEFLVPDVILLDINMPLMDGWQFIEKLRTVVSEIPERTKIYIVSSSIAYSDKERAEKFPEVTGFLSKPLTVNILKEIGESVK